MMSRVFIAIIISVVFAAPATASSWNPAQGSGEVITGYLISDAKTAISPIGDRVPLAAYDKQIVQTFGNFGLTDRWALIGSYDWQDAQIIGPDVAVAFSKPAAISAGLQYQIHRAPGRAAALSVSYYEGINLPPSLLTLENRDNTVEIRGLWGESRILGGANYFVDAQAAARLTLGGELASSRGDVTLGAQPTERSMFLLKGRYIDIEPGNFRGFAIKRQIRWESEISAVYRIWKGNHVELGYSGVIDARNAVLERGWKIGFWSQF